MSRRIVVVTAGLTVPSSTRLLADQLAEATVAQVTARGFYERAGYTAVGEEYLEAGIAHVTMRRDLR